MAGSRPTLGIDDYYEGIVSGKRHLLARAITLIESNKPEHTVLAQQLLESLMPKTGKSLRIGISGVPGVGKSTFIEAFGLDLCHRGHRVAILAVDPSSQRTGGSILGDKTRMAELSIHDNAYIRPSPTSGTLGGVAKRTRESILLCEAAGFDIILIETVGVGQSEITVSSMVDFFMVLMLPGAGDELQGIKKGIIEIADMIVLNKADGVNINKAQIAAKQYSNALQIVAPIHEAWDTPVNICSALEKTGLDSVWTKIKDFEALMKANGAFEQRRQSQQLKWMWAMIEDQLLNTFKQSPNVQTCLKPLQERVMKGDLPIQLAVDTMMQAYQQHELQ